MKELIECEICGDNLPAEFICSDKQVCFGCIAEKEEYEREAARLNTSRKKYSETDREYYCD